MHIQVPDSNTFNIDRKGKKQTAYSIPSFRLLFNQALNLGLLNSQTKHRHLPCNTKKVEPTGCKTMSACCRHAKNRSMASTKPPCFSLGLEKGKDITLPDRALHISHDETVLVIQEPDPNLGHLTP